MTEPVKYSGSTEGDKDEKSSIAPDKSTSTEPKGDLEGNTEPTSPVESEKRPFPWWIVAVIAAAVIGVGVLAIVLIRKTVRIRKNGEE